jgi:hypothetical protein
VQGYVRGPLCAGDAQQRPGRRRQRTSVAAGQPDIVGLAGLEPAPSSLSGIEGSALCGPAFPQVAGDRKGRRDAFKQPTGMRSSIVALTRAGQRPAPADGVAPAAAGCEAGGWPICCSHRWRR